MKIKNKIILSNPVNPVKKYISLLAQLNLYPVKSESHFTGTTRLFNRGGLRRKSSARYVV
jgi:hypothetical protein